MKDKILDSSTKLLLFISKSLAAAVNIQSLEFPPTHVCDIVIALSTQAPIVLTVVAGFKSDAREYVVNLARGLSCFMNKFVDENFSVYYGVLLLSDLEDADAFDTALSECVRSSSLFVTSDSLGMSLEKFQKTLKAFWMCVAHTSSVIPDDVHTMRFLTKDQCVAIVENLNVKRVVVKTVRKSVGGRVLKREVASRLRKTGKTMLRDGIGEAT